MLEAAVLSAAPLKVDLAAGVEARVETTEADGATATEALPDGVVATGTRVVLLDTGYGATATTLLSGTTEAAGAVLRMTAGVEEFATTIGATGVDEDTTTSGADETAGVTIGATGVEETAGVTIGATGVEETATGVALVAMTWCVKVQGQSVTVKVVAYKEISVSQRPQIDRCENPLLTSVTV